jgi:hypothetical protein
LSEEGEESKEECQGKENEFVDRRRRDRGRRGWTGEGACPYMGVAGFWGRFCAEVD